MKFLIWLASLPVALWVAVGLINELGDYADEVNPHNKNRDN